MNLLEDRVRLSAASDESSPVMPMPAAPGGVRVAYTTSLHPPPSPLHRIRQRHSTFGRERFGPARATIRAGIVLLSWRVHGRCSNRESISAIIHSMRSHEKVCRIKKIEPTSMLLPASPKQILLPILETHDLFIEGEVVPFRPSNRRSGPS